MSKDIRKIHSLSSELVAKSRGTMIAPKEVLKKITVLAPQAVETLEALMLRSKADSVRLKAALEILALAGVSKETKLSIRTETHELDDDSLDSRLKELMGNARDITDIATYKEVKDEESTQDEAV
jgi:hypothetical protein